MAARALTASPSPMAMLRAQTDGQFLKAARVTMSSATASSYRGSIESDLEAQLKQVVKVQAPLDVYQPLHHLVFSAPKNLASALCVAACEAVGGHRSDALTAAAALHLTHVAAITHEDLLAVPKGHLHSPFGSNIGLLTADGLISMGIELLAGSKRIQESGVADDTEDRLVRVLVEITQAIGSQGVVDRQYKEYVTRIEKGLIRAEKGKFYACGAACGAILGGGDEEEVDKLRRCGLLMGMMHETFCTTGGNVKPRGMQDMAVWRNLALNELTGFDEMRIQGISGLLASYTSDQNSEDLESQSRD
uniref:Uncharacterized protein n=1 Tax=Kalanchoe fedtschenkoi TaxID=63787 RepID=A0A7N0V0A2_KALFE